MLVHTLPFPFLSNQSVALVYSGEHERQVRDVTAWELIDRGLLHSATLDPAGARCAKCNGCKVLPDCGI